MNPHECEAGLIRIGRVLGWMDTSRADTGSSVIMSFG